MHDIKDKHRSERILEEAKKRREEKRIVDVEEEKIKIVVFTLGPEFYAFRGSDIKDILQYEPITFVPGCPDFILGIINVRGDIESVLNIHMFLGMDDEPVTNGTRIMIAEKGGIRSGILVDKVVDVLDVTNTSIKHPISTLDRVIKNFVLGQIEYNHDRSVTLLDVEKIFGKISV